MVVTIPYLFGFLFIWYAILPLTYFIIMGYGDFIGAILWIAIATFRLRENLDIFPPVGAEDSAKRVHMAEYEWYDELLEEGETERQTSSIQATLEEAVQEDEQSGE